MLKVKSMYQLLFFLLKVARILSDLELVKQLQVIPKFPTYLTYILASHLRWVHPAWHPPSHCPVTLSQKPDFEQFGLQNSAQFSPNNPTSHSVKCLVKKCRGLTSLMKAINRLKSISILRIQFLFGCFRIVA